MTIVADLLAVADYLTTDNASMDCDECERLAKVLRDFAAREAGVSFEEVRWALKITTEALDVALEPWWNGAGKASGLKLIADNRALLNSIDGANHDRAE